MAGSKSAQLSSECDVIPHYAKDVATVGGQHHHGIEYAYLYVWLLRTER